MTGPAQQALAMLDAFASVGAERFDLTITDAASGKVRFFPARSRDPLRHTMPAILQEAAAQRHNVIVRPRSTDATLLQRDDLGEDAVARLRPASLLVLRTSPGNYQAWLAVAEADADFARRLRKGAGADPTASGATRISGSRRHHHAQRHGPGVPSQVQRTARFSSIHWTRACFFTPFLTASWSRRGGLDPS